MEELNNIIDRLHMNRHRDSTRRNYYCVWKLFNNFFLKLDDKPSSWEQRIILFTGYLVQCKRKSTMVRSYISAIKAVLMEIDIKVNHDEYLLSSLTRACKLVNDRCRTRLPIQWPLLNTILTQISLHFASKGQLYLSKLYRALIASAYFGLLRVGELTSGTHPVFATDVQIAMNKKKIKFVLYTLKTHWHDSKPQIIIVRNVKKHRKLQLVENIITFRYLLQQTALTKF